jgi:hypothetical protein
MKKLLVIATLLSIIVAPTPGSAETATIAPQG